jgi:hypothetical protein
MIQAARAIDRLQTKQRMQAIAVSGWFFYMQMRIGHKISTPRVDILRKTCSHVKTSIPQPSELFFAHQRTKKKTKKSATPIAMRMQKAIQNFPMIGLGRPCSIS